jgi:hypothetical protein
MGGNNLRGNKQHLVPAHYIPKYGYRGALRGHIPLTNKQPPHNRACHKDHYFGNCNKMSCREERRRAQIDHQS